MEFGEGCVELACDAGQLRGGNDQPQLALVDVVDGEGTSYVDGTEADLKLIIENAFDPNCAVHILVRVTGAPLDVLVTIDLEPGGDPERVEFYREYVARGHLGYPSVFRTRAGVLQPGEHSICWSGRDKTPDNRILLGGAYRVRVTAQPGSVPLSSDALLVVAAPRAELLGIRYRRANSGWHDTASKLRGMAGRLGRLTGQRRYRADAEGALTGAEAVQRWARCALAVFDGHGNPLEIYFHSFEGELYRADRASYIGMHDPPPAWRRRGSINLARVRRGSFGDVLLAIVLGCNTGRELFFVQRKLNWVRDALALRRASGRLNSATRRALATFQAARELPRTGDLDDATMAALEITPGAWRREDVRAAQEKLLHHRDRMEELETTDELDDPTRFTLEAFQALAGIPETGRPDALTLDRLALGEEDEQGRNIAAQFVREGCDVAIGFPNTSSFGIAEQWLSHLLHVLGRGERLHDALQAATDAVPAEYRSEYDHNIYSRDGVDGDALRIVPARYGARPTGPARERPRDANARRPGEADCGCD